MLFETRKVLLEKIYALHDDFTARFDLACGRGCDLCCTVNVTMTTLEGLLIMRHWEARGQQPPLEALRAAAGRDRFQPTLTTNHIAALCLQEQEIPEEAADPDAGPCPLLQDGCCTIYEVRPFGCRAMVSRSRCMQGGTADMPDPVLSANHLMLQFIEAIDVPGVSGNLTDVLLWLSASELRDRAADGQAIEPPRGMAANRSIPVIMVPPEHRALLQPLIQTLIRLGRRGGR